MEINGCSCFSKSCMIPTASFKEHAMAIVKMECPIDKININCMTIAPLQPQEEA